MARDLPADLRRRELSAALELVRGEPLEGHAYSWATDICEQAIVQLQDAALELARASREAGDLDTAERAIEQGLKLLDPNGWLYLERAQLASLRRRPEQPLRIFEQYRRKLADDADEIAGTVATPPPEIELAFRELTSRARRAAATTGSGVSLRIAGSRHPSTSAPQIFIGWWQEAAGRRSYEMLVSHQHRHLRGMG